MLSFVDFLFLLNLYFKKMRLETKREGHVWSQRLPLYCNGRLKYIIVICYCFLFFFPETPALTTPLLMTIKRYN